MEINLDIIFIASVVLGICVIASKNPIISVLYLIGLFLAIALYLMQINISFIGLAYLLVYVGAISILFLFILMLINVRVSELVTNNNNGIPLSLLAVALFTFVFNKLDFIKKSRDSTDNYFSDKLDNIRLQSAENKLTITDELEMLQDNNIVYYSVSKVWDGLLSHTSHIASIGNILYTSYPMLLLITSVILLLAMIGSIVITINKN